MIHVIRSIALLFRWSWIALSYNIPSARRCRPITTTQGTTHQILRNSNLLVQHLHPRPDLQILPHRIVQRLQTRLVPEELRNIQHVANQVHVAPQREQPARQAKGVLAFQREHARRRELLRYRARLRGGEDAGSEGLVVREEGRLCERVRNGQLEEVRVCFEREKVVVDPGKRDVRVMLKE